jgi:hypothetical protein
MKPIVALTTTAVLGASLLLLGGSALADHGTTSGEPDACYHNRTGALRLDVSGAGCQGDETPVVVTAGVTTRYVTATTVLPTDGFGGVTAECDHGEVVLGGGFGQASINPDVAIVTNAPITLADGRQGWQSTVSAGLPIQIWAYAVCAHGSPAGSGDGGVDVCHRNSTGALRVDVSGGCRPNETAATLRVDLTTRLVTVGESAPASGFATATAECGSGEVASGGGFEIASIAPEISVVHSIPDVLGDHREGWFVQLLTHAGSSGSDFSAVAVCASGALAGPGGDRLAACYHNHTGAMRAEVSPSGCRGNETAIELGAAFTTWVTAADEVPAPGFLGVEAECGDGQVAVGGGLGIVPTPHTAIVVNAPALVLGSGDRPHGWHLQVGNDIIGGDPASIFAFAVCAPGSSG